jgi:hypothetical protein
MARARKLFPSYGSALVNKMLGALTHDHLVDHFVQEYVSKHERGGILGGPSRDRELSETIGREILLAMIVEVHERLPAFFGRKPQAKLRKEETEALDAFAGELVAALDRAQKWTPEDRRQFGRDLGLYADFKARRHKAPKPGKDPKKAMDEAPFIARVALLLDPSMLEVAREATAKFHEDVGMLARKLLRQTLG